MGGRTGSVLVVLASTGFRMRFSDVSCGGAVVYGDEVGAGRLGRFGSGCISCLAWKEG